MYKSKMMIVMRKDLKMRKGKIAAQAGHACVEAVLMALQKENRLNDIEESSDGVELNRDNKINTPLSEWFHYGCAKVCVYVDSEAELLDIARIATEKGESNVVYRDTTAKKGTKYYYKVKAYYSKTQSACSDTKTVIDKY